MEQDEESEDEFEDIVRNCLREGSMSSHHKENQNNRSKGYNQNHQQEKLNSSGKSGREDNYGKDEEEYEYNEYDNDNSDNRNKNTQRRTYSQTTQKSQSNQFEGAKQSERHHGTRIIDSPLQSIEPCIIHCIFKQKKMLNKNNYIDKTKAMHVLTQKIRNSELQEFVEDSVNECFDKIDDGNKNSEGKCDDSKKFALCLEEKGKNNCEDWDTNSNHTKDNMNTFSNYNVPEESQSNKGERGNNRHQQFDTNNGGKEKISGCFSRNEREERDRSKMKHEISNDNNHRTSNSDNNEQKIKFSDYFQTRG